MVKKRRIVSVFCIIKKEFIIAVLVKFHQSIYSLKSVVLLSKFYHLSLKFSSNIPFAHQYIPIFKPPFSKLLLIASCFIFSFVFPAGKSFPLFTDLVNTRTMEFSYKSQVHEFRNSKQFNNYTTICPLIESCLILQTFEIFLSW